MPLSYTGAFTLDGDEDLIKIRAYHAAIIPDNFRVDK